MKTRFLIINILVLIIMGIGFNNCKKKEPIPFQGPRDASFESYGIIPAWVPNTSFFLSGTGSQDITLESNGSPSYGFMPSNGNYYINASVHLSNVTRDVPNELLYQQDVDLSHSNKMIFDYSFIGKNNNRYTLVTVKK